MSNTSITIVLSKYCIFFVGTIFPTRVNQLSHFDVGSHLERQKGIECKAKLFFRSERPQFLVQRYRKTSNISRTSVGNNIVENSDEVGASPVGTAPTTSSFST